MRINSVKQVIAHDLLTGDLKSISVVSDECDNQIIKTIGYRSEKYTQGNSSYETTLNMYNEPEQIKINGENYCKITHDYNGEYTQTEYANGEIFKVNRDEYGLHNDYYYTDKNGNGGVETCLEEDYDLNGNIIYIQDHENKAGHTVFYNEFDKPWLRTFDVLNSGITLEYEYNNKKALSKKEINVESENTDIETYTYDNQDDKLLEVAHSAVGKESLKYDCLSRLTDYSKAENKISKKLTYKKVGERTSNLLQSETLLLNDVSTLKLAYSYDKYGRITEIKENGKLKNRYSYDAVGRIAREDNKNLDKTIVFNYDNSGNILERYEYPFTLGSVDELTPVENKYSYSATGGDRLKAYNGEVCSYDVLGNPTVYRGKTVTWSHVNRMDSYNGINYTYNYAGIRTGKTVNGVLTKYYYADEDLLGEDNGTRKITYIHGVDGISAFKKGNEVYYYLKNQLGDVYAITDASGNIVAKYEYDAFGNHKVLNPDGTENTNASFIGNINPIRYRSYYYDVETGLYYLQSRYYDPETGRFITADSIEYLDLENVNGLNLYSYCGNNPVMYVDPSGCLPEWLKWLAGGLAIFGAALVVGAVTVLTCGVGTLAGTMTGAVIYGAAQGIAIGATVGVVAGGIVGGIATDWSAEGILIGIGIGLCAGAIIGGVIGGFVGASGFTANSAYISQYDGNVKEVLSAFKGNPKLRVLKDNTTVFRTWGGASPKYGHWISPKNYGSAARNLLSLPAGNTATNTSTFLISKGTVVLKGKAAALFGQMGGGIQWWIGLL